MKNRQLKIIIIASIVASLLGLAGCSTAKVEEFAPDARMTSAIIFGYVKVFRNKVDTTQDARIYLEDGQTISLDQDGFVAIHVYPGRNAIRKVTIRESGTEYTIANLGMRSGGSGTKTYFGNIVFNIVSPPPTAMDMTEKWNWSVSNHWKDAWTQWNRMFGADRRKFYASMAERTGPDRVQTRAIATDRQEVAPGF